MVPGARDAFRDGARTLRAVDLGRTGITGGDSDGSAARAGGAAVARVPRLSAGKALLDAGDAGLHPAGFPPAMRSLLLSLVTFALAATLHAERLAEHVFIISFDGGKPA